MMKKHLSKILLMSGALVMFLGLAPMATAVIHTGGPMNGVITHGECDPVVPGVAQHFDCGADDCAGFFGSCDDGPWQNVTYTGSGKCVGEEGRCGYQNVPFFSRARYDCKCQDDGRTCAFNGLQGGGPIIMKKDCFNIG